MHKLSAFMRTEGTVDGYASIQDFVAHAVACKSSRCPHLKRAQSAETLAMRASGDGTPRNKRKSSLPDCAETDTKSTQQFEQMAKTQVRLLSAAKGKPSKKDAIIRDYLGQKREEKQLPLPKFV